MAKQGGVCAICQERVPTHLDHDHAGKGEKHQDGERIRGALCVSCNNALGLLRDDAARFRRAATYLEGT